MQTKLRRAALAMGLIGMLAACSEVAKSVAAQEPTKETACAVDGMVLQDFPGSKAQVQYAEGKPDFYCDLMELFAVLLAPENKRQVVGVYVQDMGKADWTNPVGHWIAAKEALYVVGSKKQGSMGPTFGAFSNAQDAAAFAQKEGGKVLPYKQITAAMLDTRGAMDDTHH
ncbi:MAG: nitrous oxide reductase accessory protein NosL [Pseudomonadota bacterium]